MSQDALKKAALEGASLAPRFSVKISLKVGDAEVCSNGPTTTGRGTITQDLQSFWDSLQDLGGHASGQVIGIDYTNSKGENSRRRIRIQRCYENDYGSIFIRAFCFERKASRTFVVDRINFVFDANGEIFEDAYQYLADTFGIEGVLLSEVDSASAGLLPPRYLQPYITVLTAIARADNELHAKEVEAIVAYCRACSIDHNGDLDAEAEINLRAYLDRHFPDEEMIEAAISQIGKNRRAANRFWAAAEAVILADGTVDPAEKALIARLGRGKRVTADLPWRRCPSSKHMLPPEDWAWIVPFGYRTALDFVFSERQRGRGWTVGSPRLFSFRPNDVFNKADGSAALQVLTAIPDSSETPGSVTFAFYQDQAPKPKTLTISQAAFAQGLITGLWHGSHDTGAPAVGDKARLSVKTGGGAASGPLQGEVFVFSGTIPGRVTRKDAQDQVKALGAIVKNAVTVNTTIFVTDGTQSSKFKAAQALVAKGAPLRVVSVEDYLTLLEGWKESA